MQRKLRLFAANPPIECKFFSPPHYGGNTTI
jgi:hypothetical protein